MKSPLNFGSTGFLVFWCAPIVAADIVITQESPHSMMPSVVAIKPVGPVKKVLKFWLMQPLKWSLIKCQKYIPGLWLHM